jgi:predicted metal-binding membrane protein
MNAVRQGNEIPEVVLPGRDGWMTGAVLALAVALSWWWIVAMAIDMYGPMTGWSAWMMTSSWDYQHEALLFAMWALMMMGMMLPSTTPTFFLYASVHRDSPGKINMPALAFAAGYLVVWTTFSLAATALQLELTRRLLLSPMMEVRSNLLAGGILLLAGIYQFTPIKRACLDCCRSPALFNPRGLESTVGDGFRTGLIQGMKCLGCCWAMMLLLFVGGVMNLWWIGGLALLVLLEKLAPFGMQAGRVCGLLMIVAGLAVLA